MSSVPIIGIGAISAAGSTADTAYNAVSHGVDGLMPLSLFDAGLKTVPLCGQVRSTPQFEKYCTVADRSTALALCAAHEALAPVADLKNLRLGLVLATTVGGITLSENFYEEFRKNPAFASRSAEFLSGHEPAATAGAVARSINAQGFHTVSTACSTGLHAIGMAKRLIEQGRYDLCMAIGTDALCRLTMRGFASLMLIDMDGCKPFDKRRVGISLGEGAGALLLASDDVCATLGVSPLALTAGWGASADCHHMTAPHPEGKGAIAAVRSALAEASMAPDSIDMIATHGTATPDNDSAEIKAMQTVFSVLPPFTSMKRSLGHTLAASGAIEAVFSVLSIINNTIPATGGYEQADEKIGCAPSVYVQKPVHTVLKNSFGFGGNNAALILTKN
jgi:3-oxoacyl-[acyl-carrier-protein] synthase-1